MCISDIVTLTIFYLVDVIMAVLEQDEMGFPLSTQTSLAGRDL